MSEAPTSGGPAHASAARRAHWEGVYSQKPDAKLSWHQSDPTTSLALLAQLPAPPARVVDVGGGQSALAGILLERPGIEDVAVLDISLHAIDRARERLGPAAASRVRWICCDLLAAQGIGPVDLWHDRAVFHFLVDPADRARYIEAAARAVVPGGHAIVATFAPTGPERCSDLPVQRWDAPSLAAAFAPAFTLAAAATEQHVTPWGATQDFSYALLRRA